MVLKPKKIVKLSNVSFAQEMTFYYLDTLEELERLAGNLVFETEIDWFTVQGSSVFRVLKSDRLPRIVKTKSLELNPDAYMARVELTQEELFSFAKREQLFIFECGDTFYLPSSIVMFAHKKPGSK